MKHQIASDLTAFGAKVSPAVGVGVAAQAGWGVQEWMYAATVAYIVLQAAYLIWKWRREAKAKP